MGAPIGPQAPDLREKRRDVIFLAPAGRNLDGATTSKSPTRKKPHHRAKKATARKGNSCRIVRIVRYRDATAWETGGLAVNPWDGTRAAILLAMASQPDSAIVATIAGGLRAPVAWKKLGSRYMTHFAEPSTRRKATFVRDGFESARYRRASTVG